MDRYWLLTWTTYGTWLPGDRRGFVSPVRDAGGDLVLHNVPGTPCDADEPALQRAARAALKGGPIYLGAEHASPLLEQFRQTAVYRGWQLCAVAIMANHVHLVVGVSGDPDPANVLHSFKSYGSRALNGTWGKPAGGTWWTQSGSRRKLPDESAVRAAVSYVLQQQRPLIVWAAEELGERGVSTPRSEPLSDPRLASGACQRPDEEAAPHRGVDTPRSPDRGVDTPRSPTAMELMICCAARALEDGRTVAVGTGVPCAAAMLAQRTHAPNLVILFEAGGVAPQLPTMPVSVGDSRTFWRAVMATSMADVMETCQRGMIDYTFLGGAQIDAFGNLNSTRIGGDHAKPKVRLPGSGGANDLASFCWRILVVTQHDRRRFVERLDFLTTPGYLTGPGAREAAGLPSGAGPYRVITDLAVMGYHDETKRMQVLSLHPGVTLERVRAATGFALGAVEPLPETPLPTPHELDLLRREVDPHGFVLGR